MLDQKEPQKGTTRETLRTRVQKAWTLLKSPRADPQYWNLPQGLSHRIDSNKDSLKDKIRRLRHRNKGAAPPVPQKSSKLQFPDPIHGENPHLNPVPPRSAPSVRPPLKVDNPGPAFDENQNPLGGEHSVFYETAEEREARNKETQRECDIRTASDRFLAQRRQKHLRNSVIGRAPPFSKAYMEEEARRLALIRKRTAEVNPRASRLNIKETLMFRRKPRVVVDPKELGLPIKGAPVFQWDRALLSSKKMPNFAVNEHGDEEIPMSRTSTVPTASPEAIQSQGHPAEEYPADEAHPQQVDLTIYERPKPLVEHAAEAGSATQAFGPVLLNNQSARDLPHSYNETFASRGGPSDDSSSDYSDKLESDENLQTARINTSNQNSEYHAELYRKELRVIPNSADTSDNELQPSPAGPRPDTLTRALALRPSRAGSGMVAPVIKPNNAFEEVDQKRREAWELAENLLTGKVIVPSVAPPNMEFTTENVFPYLKMLGALEEEQRSDQLTEASAQEEEQRSDHLTEASAQEEEQRSDQLREASVLSPAPASSRPNNRGYRRHDAQELTPQVFNSFREPVGNEHNDTFGNEYRSQAPSPYLGTTGGIATTPLSSGSVVQGGRVKAVVSRSGNVVARAQGLIPQDLEQSRDTTQSGHRLQGVPPQFCDGPGTSRIPRMNQSRAPELRQAQLQPEYSSGRLPHNHQSGRYWPREKGIRSPRVNCEDSEEETRLSQDGPYPKLPGRSQRSVEETPQRSRQRAASALTEGSRHRNTPVQNEQRERNRHVSEQGRRQGEGSPYMSSALRNEWSRRNQPSSNQAREHGDGSDYRGSALQNEMVRRAQLRGQGQDLPPLGQDRSHIPYDSRSQLAQRPTGVLYGSEAIGSSTSEQAFAARNRGFIEEQTRSQEGQRQQGRIHIPSKQFGVIYTTAPIQHMANEAEESLFREGYGWRPLMPARQPHIPNRGGQNNRLAGAGGRSGNVGCC
jgi:hypothetical protein